MPKLLGTGMVPLKAATFMTRGLRRDPCVWLWEEYESTYCCTEAGGEDSTVTCAPVDNGRLVSPSRAGVLLVVNISNANHMPNTEAQGSTVVIKAPDGVLAWLASALDGGG